MANTMTTHTTPAAPSARLRWALIGMTATLTAMLALPASAQMPGPGSAGGTGTPALANTAHRGHHGDGPGFGGGMLRHSPERMGRMIDRMLDGLSANDAQRTQIKQIAAAAATDLRAHRAAGRSLRERGAQALLAPNVDAAAAEQVRQQMLQQHDQTSRRLSQAMIDVARVLTPEQRAKAAERLRDRQSRWDERRKRIEQRGPR